MTPELNHLYPFLSKINQFKKVNNIEITYIKGI